MGPDDHADLARPHVRQVHVPQQEVAKQVPLHHADLLARVIEVGRRRGVRVGDEQVARFGQQVRHRHAVAAEAAELGAHAGEGGAWGMALLAGYMLHKSANEPLEAYLPDKVFAGEKGLTMAPDPEDAAGFAAFMDRYKKGLGIERAAVDLRRLDTGFTDWLNVVDRWRADMLREGQLPGHMGWANPWFVKNWLGNIILAHEAGFRPKVG